MQVERSVSLSCGQFCSSTKFQPLLPATGAPSVETTAALTEALRVVSSTISTGQAALEMVSGNAFRDDESLAFKILSAVGRGRRRS